MVSFITSTVAITSLIIFLGHIIILANIYHRRKTNLLSKLEPFWPRNGARDIYFSLLHLEDPHYPPYLLQAALFERAKEAISRIHILNDSKNVARKLLAKGVISEATSQLLAVAEMELTAEIVDIMVEARALGGDEWADSIMSQANEYTQKSGVLKSLEQLRLFPELDKEYGETEKELKEDGTKQ
jgi:translocation protein SEC66